MALQSSLDHINVASIHLQFNFGFLINHAVGDVALITLYIYQYCTNFSVLGFIWTLFIRALRCILDHVNVASIHLAIQFRVFDQSCRSRWSIITLYIYQLWTILSVLGFIWKLQFKTLGNSFDHVNVANIHLAIQFRVFDQLCKRKGYN